MDVTIRNPNILNYLTLKSPIPPVAELRYLFEHPEVQPNVIKDIELRTVRAIQVATKNRESSFPSDQITARLVMLAMAIEVFRKEDSSEQEREEVLKDLCEALRYLWNL